MFKLNFSLTQLIPVLLICSSIGCVASKDDGNAEIDDSGNLNLEISASTNSRGLASASFRTSEDVSKLSITAQTSDNKFVKITDLTVDGQDYLSPRGESLSLASNFSKLLATANVPSRDTDPVLNSPSEVMVSAEVQNSGSSGSNSQNSEQVLFKVTSRKDGNFSSGRLRLNVFYVGAVGVEQGTKRAMQSGLSLASSIFSSAGINLSISEFDVGGSVIIPSPVSGDKLYGTNSADAVSPAVNVFVGGDIDGFGGTGEVLGVSASIPGPPTPTNKSAVIISVFASAGADGVFDSEDTRILGETIAHESAHFMGLFHPVDFSGSVVSNTDPLSDTAGCSFITECVSKEELVTNLMFPNPIEDGRGGFIPQNTLTSQQKGVLNRYAAVD